MQKNVLIYTDNYGDENKVALVLNMYADNDNLFVGLEEHDEEFDCWDSYCDVTVNIIKLPFLESAINMNYGGQEKIDFLIKNGFGELTGKTLNSGFCQYPVFKFNEEKLREIDPIFYTSYANAHGRDVRSQFSLDDKINCAKEITPHKQQIKKTSIILPDKEI